MRNHSSELTSSRVGIHARNHWGGRTRETDRSRGGPLAHLHRRVTGTTHFDSLPEFGYLCLGRSELFFKDTRMRVCHILLMFGGAILRLEIAEFLVYLGITTSATFVREGADLLYQRRDAGLLCLDRY